MDPWEQEMADDEHEKAESETKAMPAPMSKDEVCVPVSAVAIADGEEMTQPEPGDQVAVTLEGKVVRVADGNVYFKAETANGEPMPGPMPSEDEALEAEGAALRASLNV